MMPSTDKVDKAITIPVKAINLNFPNLGVSSFFVNIEDSSVFLNAIFIFH
jgi:hypothetical protein